MAKQAVILFNLGGPDNLKAVRPFLYNLFNDPAIIGLPTFLRTPLAKFISMRRAKTAKEIYQQIGGKSPLLDLTQKQREALELVLKKEYPNREIKVFISMRYWRPMSSETMEEVITYDPDEILLLPLYPQFSTTTTGSSFLDWHRTSSKKSFRKPTFSVCCYFTQKKWVAAQANLLAQTINSVPDSGNIRVLFSAHGLPKKIIELGDPYQKHVEQSAKLIAEVVGLENENWRVCYQSRVGPLEWIGPSLDEELQQAAKDRVILVVLPIAFVSEHSETLVELDIEYRKTSEELGIRGYYRVPALGTHPVFISGLKDIVNAGFERRVTMEPWNSDQYCSQEFNKCPCREM